MSPSNLIAGRNLSRAWKLMTKANQSKMIPVMRMSTNVSADNSVAGAMGTKVSTLDNAMRVATEEYDSPTATFGLWINAGSAQDPTGKSGTAHFLEHMLFKGTSNRSKSNLELEIESMGALINAYTSREQMVFYARCLKSDVPKTFEILSDIILNSKLAEQDIESERSVILTEMQNVDMNHKEVVLDYLHSVAYQGTALGNTILGPTKNVMSINRDDLDQYRKANFKGSNIVVAGAGGVGHEELVSLTKKHYGAVDNKIEIGAGVSDTYRYTGSDVRERNDDMPFCNVALAFNTCGHSSPDNVPLLIAGNVLGNWSRSNSAGLHPINNLSDNFMRHNVGEHFECFTTNYKTTGLWGVYYTAKGPDVLSASYIVIKDLIRIANSVTDSEVERAKNLTKTIFKTNIDGTERICENVGRQMLNYGRVIPYEEFEARIDAVDAKVVKNTLFKYLYDQCPVVASLGPVEGVPNYVNFRRFFTWLSA